MQIGMILCNCKIKNASFPPFTGQDGREAQVVPLILGRRSRKEQNKIKRRGKVRPTSRFRINLKIK